MKVQALILLPLLSLALGPPAAAEPVVAFGDSWAEGGAAPLAQALSGAGLAQFTVYNGGVPGSTAEEWAVTNPMAMSNAVFANPDARWVWLSIGGNDVTDLHTAGQGNLAAGMNDLHIRQMLDAFFVFHPDVRVVFFGYDYVNFDQSQLCRDQAATFFFAGITPLEVNQIFLRDVGAVLQAIAQDYDNVSYVPIWGTLQVAGGVPGAPDVSQPSPAALLFDCFHPTATGYRALGDALVAAYWEVSAPTVSLLAPATVGCVGDRITFNAQGSNAAGYRWRVDGAPLGNTNSQEVLFDQAGAVTVQVQVYNQAYDAQATQVVNISSCLDAGVPDQGLPDAEPLDALVPDEGFPDLGFEPDAAVPDAFLPDAVPFDSGVEPVDGGFIMPDAGFPPVHDGGVLKPMVGGEWTLGGGCQAQGGPTHRGSPIYGLLLVGAGLLSASSSWASRRRLLRRP